MILSDNNQMNCKLIISDFYTSPVLLLGLQKNLIFSYIYSHLFIHIYMVGNNLLFPFYVVVTF